MAISVDFGTCNVENEVVDKGATGAITWTNQNVNCDWLNTDILNPVLKVQSGKVNCNYVKINIRKVLRQNGYPASICCELVHGGSGLIQQPLLFRFRRRKGIPAGRQRGNRANGADNVCIFYVHRDSGCFFCGKDRLHQKQQGHKQTEGFSKLQQGLTLSYMVSK